MSADRDDGGGRGGEKFLSRWSRLKQEVKTQSCGPDAESGNPSAVSRAADSNAPPPELPPLDSLTLESDYRDFMHPQVDAKVRLAALNKLFSDPHFNVMDGLDVYIDDYSRPDPLPAAMLASLRQAQKILEWAKETPEEAAARRAAAITDPALPAPPEAAAPAAELPPAVVAESPPAEPAQNAVQAQEPAAGAQQKP